MNTPNLVQFQFQTSEVRVIKKDDNICFVASDIAKSLGYRDAEKLIRILDEDELGGTLLVGTVSKHKLAMRW